MAMWEYSGFFNSSCVTSFLTLFILSGMALGIFMDDFFLYSTPFFKSIICFLAFELSIM